MAHHTTVVGLLRAFRREERSRIERHFDAGDLAALDVAPVGHGDRRCRSGAEVEDGDGVGLVGERLVHHDVGHDLR